MTVFRILRAATGAVLRVGSARDAPGAPDTRADAAGYRVRTSLPDPLRAGGFPVAAIGGDWRRLEP